MFTVGGIAAAINAVAGGGSLISFPTLRFGLGIDPTIANATNSVALWPGSLTGALGFNNVIERTKHHLKTLLLPTIVGSATGAYLMASTDPKDFDLVVPWLILLAATLLVFQPKIKAFAMRSNRTPHPFAAILGQFLVSVYGGYFGAGMGIMMLGAFALYMDGTIHELNAVKNWLGLVINLTCSTIFFTKGLIDFHVAVWLALGSIVGGFYAAKLSLKVNPDKLRTVIAIYGVGMAAYYMAKSWGLIGH